MADMYLGDSAGSAQRAAGGFFGVLFNWTGAIMSVALVGGLAMWGYQLAMRDVTGVPVVRALAGPMRIAPEDPGGERAAHQGLAVNSVAADGTAEPPADRLILAPAPLDLAAEDLPRAKLTETEVTPEVTPVEMAAETQLDADDVLAMAEGLSDGVTPLSGTIAPPEPSADVILASVGGVSRSPLPLARPGGDAIAEAVARAVMLASAPTLASAPVSGVEVEADSLAVGTRLVQFGAFDSPDEARAAWDKLDARFTDFLAEKQRVIQQAVSGGKTFYRLRAMGFADIDDARRFCVALLAERQACIPVVIR